MPDESVLFAAGVYRDAHRFVPSASSFGAFGRPRCATCGEAKHNLVHNAKGLARIRAAAEARQSEHSDEPVVRATPIESDRTNEQSDDPGGYKRARGAITAGPDAPESVRQTALELDRTNEQSDDTGGLP